MAIKSFITLGPERDKKVIIIKLFVTVFTQIGNCLNAEHCGIKFYTIESKSNVCLGGLEQTWVASMCEIGKQKQLNETEWYLVVLDLFFTTQDGF
jgi:hypothetical protein